MLRICRSRAGGSPERCHFERSEKSPAIDGDLSSQTTLLEMTKGWIPACAGMTIFSLTRITTLIGIFFLFIPTLLAADLKVKSNGVAELNGKFYRCALGKNGVALLKTEGDLKTPLGKFPLRCLYYRPDKFPKRIHTKLTQKNINPNLGWCDDPTSIYYNQALKLPFSGHYERLWRDDNVYDLVLVVGYNDAPVESGKGSAIFIHIARDNYAPTYGCIVFSKKDLLKILSLLDKKSSVIIDTFS